jgi:hypothetical protein
MSRRAICALSAVVLVAAVGLSGQAPARRPPAPTFYLVIDARTCEPDSIKISGASNLPAGALIGLEISDFNEDAWKDYSDTVYISLKEDGLFEKILHPKPGQKFRRNLLAQAYFSPVYVPPHMTQPPNVLKMVGTKGQYLGGFENPQAGQISGNNHYLSTIARVPWCGEGLKPHP